MDGILVVDKPQGVTSHDVVDIVRKRFGVKKAGHAGTLDPMATGVLVLLIGVFTKLSAQFMSGDKEYEAGLVLGATSDTQDAWGNISPGGSAVDADYDGIRKVFAAFVGEIEHLPPMYSAVRYKGRKLYELARKGISVDIKPRKAVIKSLDILNMRLPEISFRVNCSKGTYVRQLCADIGEKLGCGAYMSRLVRTRSGKFTLEQAVKLDEIRGFKRDDLEKILINKEGA